jgi:hypothetical protein
MQLVASLIRMQKDNKKSKPLIVGLGLIGCTLIAFIYTITIISVYMFIKNLIT